jgi:hypothetical protein
VQKIGNITKTADKQGEFTNGGVAEGIEPTELDCQWFNTIQRELIAVLAAAGINMIPENDAQLVEAIKTLLKKGDDAVRQSVYLKEDADKRFLLTNTKIPDAYSKKEANKRFQPAGSYEVVGYAYSKKESDKKYLGSDTKIPDAYQKIESDKRYMKAGDEVDLSDYYKKEEIERTFVKNTLVTNDFKGRKSPIGSIGLFYYTGEMAQSAGTTVAGSTLNPACIRFFDNAQMPSQYSGGDPEKMPGVWSCLGQIAMNCVSLFVRVK